jgi:hypothetical protein
MSSYGGNPFPSISDLYSRGPNRAFRSANLMSFISSSRSDSHRGIAWGEPSLRGVRSPVRTLCLTCRPRLVSWVEENGTYYLSSSLDRVSIETHAHKFFHPPAISPPERHVLVRQVVERTVLAKHHVDAGLVERKELVGCFVVWRVVDREAMERKVVVIESMGLLTGHRRPERQQIHNRELKGCD